MAWPAWLRPGRLYYPVGGVTAARTRAVPFVDLSRQHAPLAAELHAALDRVLDASAFILGEEVERFEAAFASFCGVGHCVGVGSGTAALTIMLQAVGIGPGDEVIVPAHTFIATALAVLHAGATPVCAEVERGTGLIDPDAALAAIGSRTAAIVPVHLRPAVRDGATASACEPARPGHLRGRGPGSRRRVPQRACGPPGVGGGVQLLSEQEPRRPRRWGAICTSDAGLAARARSLRNLGRGPGSPHTSVGYNERLDGLQAAFLRIKLPHLDGWNQARRAIAGRYRERLSGAVELLEERRGARCVYHVFPIRVGERAELAHRLAAHGIATGIYYPVTLPHHPALPMLGRSDTPGSDDWAARELSLPIFPEMTDDEVELVSAIVRDNLGEERQSPIRTATQF